LQYLHFNMISTYHAQSFVKFIVADDSIFVFVEASHKCRLLSFVDLDPHIAESLDQFEVRYGAIFVGVKLPHQVHAVVLEAAVFGGARLYLQQSLVDSHVIRVCRVLGRSGRGLTAKSFGDNGVAAS